MKNKYSIYIFLIFCMLQKAFLFSLTDKEKFVKANTLYEKHSFDDARQLYESISDKGFQEWFNIGNTYFKLGKYAHAINAWKRAQQFSNFQESNDIDYNITKANEKLGKKIETNTLSDLYSHIKKYINLIPIIHLQIILLLCWYLCLIFFKRIFRNGFNFILLLLLSFNFIILGCAGIKYSEQNKKIGIIIENELPVYAGPDKLFHKIGSLNLADEVLVRNQINKWIKISANNLNGWILTDSLLII